jgi:predicted metal-dependent phosphoesterase TrpH
MIVDTKGNKWYKAGLHIHTTLSDGKLTPQQVMERYRMGDYDVVALTDHWHYGPGGQSDGMLILSGCEYNLGSNDGGDVMHIVGFGMTRQPALTQEASRQQVVDGINACGGIAVLAHPAWSLNTPDDAVALTGVDFTEVYNAVSEAHQSIRPNSEYFAELCANAGIHYGLLATDDAHYYDGSDDQKGWVMIRAEALSREAILAALRAGDYYASQGPQLYVRREGNRFMVDCSPCTYVAAMSNSTWTQGRVLRGENLTRFEYEAKPSERWIRIQACDSAGKLAWSRIYKV